MFDALSDFRRFRYESMLEVAAKTLFSTSLNRFRITVACVVWPVFSDCVPFS